MSHPTPISDMNALPFPDYSDYFARLRRSPLKERLDRRVAIETSRGCWWGAKQHCTFCGLNGQTMAYRSKTPERSLEEFTHLSRTYGTTHVDCVDNILDTRYIRTLFPKLIESGLNLNLFFEVKSNLRYDQLSMLRAGGTRMIQPGIESFSNQVLRSMRKGCTGLQNIQLLRWCEELGIEAMWNILAGFPGESPAEYDRQAELLPLLTHLHPPISCAAVRLDRFSPLFTKSAEYGLERVRPAGAYAYVFPLGQRELSKLAYFFDFDYPGGQRPNHYLTGLRKEVATWWAARTAPRAPRLEAFSKQGALVIEDSRRIAAVHRHCLTGLPSSLYLRCDTAQTVTGLCRAFSTAGESEIRSILEGFLAARIMVEMEGHYLSLAVFKNRASLERLMANDSAQPEPTTTSEPLLRVV